MEIILIEVLLWAGLIFFFWALRDGLNQAEAEAEGLGQPAPVPQYFTPEACYDRPDNLSEPIGKYRGTQIYRVAVIEGRSYQFQHILPWESLAFLVAGERCIAPGLVYAMSSDKE